MDCICVCEMCFFLCVFRDPSLEISILDIFGFEKLQKNNFEQVRMDTMGF